MLTPVKLVLEDILALGMHHRIHFCHIRHPQNFVANSKK